MKPAISRPGDAASELASQRVRAEGRIAVRERGGRTHLAELYQSGAAKIRMPRPEGDWLEAILINTAGGLTGGDRLSWQVDVGPQACAVVTTQACEKVYRAEEGDAEVSVLLSVGTGGTLAWLPQETIVFDRSAFRRRLDLDLAEGATALVCESTVFGRTAMGEVVATGSFRDRWRIFREGRLIHAEDFALNGAISDALQEPAVAGGAVAVATVLLVRDDSRHFLEPVRALIGEAGGASALQVGRSGKLLARLCASDGFELRKRLVPLLDLLNGRAGLPKTWSL